MNNTHILTQLLTTAASRELHLLHELHQVLEAAADDLGAQIFVKDMIWYDLETNNTPWKINVIHHDTAKNGEMEDDVPFRLGDFQVPNS